MALVKEEAKQVLDKLSENATWDDLMYELYVKQKVAGAEEAVASGNVISHPEARKRLAKR